MVRRDKALSVWVGFMSDWAVKAWSRGGAGIALVAVVAVWATLSAAPAAAGTMVSPGASLLDSGLRVHPDPALQLGAPDKLNVFIDAALPPEWTLVATLTGTPLEGTLDVVVRSQVWRHTDEHLLFAYQVENLATSTSSLSRGNVVGYGDATDVVDCGILDFGGDVDFDQGDVLRLRRPAGAESQFKFAFEATGDMGQTIRRMLAPGETSSWFYAETASKGYVLSASTVQDSGQSAKGMEVLVPHPDPGVPEPATIALMGVGVVAMVMARRRRRAP